MIAVVMFGLALTLTIDDFRRVAKVRRPVAIALCCQIVVLPAICYGIAVLFQLPPNLAVGLMLMAASPGGAMANILSHLADGDLALNLTLTAHFQILGGAVLTLCVTSLTLGYAVPRSMQLPRRRAIAISLEIGLHNTVLAVAIAMSPSLLNNPAMAVPGALHGVLAVFVALAFILLVNRLDTAQA